MTVLVLVEYGWRNGGENSWLAVAKLLGQHGWQFVVACPPRTEFAEHLTLSGLPTVPWEVHDNQGLRKTRDVIRGEIADLIRQLHPALVHCNSLSTSRLAGPVTRDLGLPSIGHLRDIVKLSRKAVADINGLSAVVAVSHATKTFHLAQGMCPDRTLVIHNGVDLNEFIPRPASHCLHYELQIPKTCRLIVCVGQIGLRKGTDCVIESFLNLALDFPELHLLIVGMRNSIKDEAIRFEERCRQMTQATAIGNRIHWLGRRTDVARILTEATLLLHGARQEPLGRVLLEAAASGCPFVATDVGGTMEIVEGSGCEFLVAPVDSVPEMSATAHKLLNDEPLRLKTSKQLREVAEARFDAHDSAEQLETVYRRLVS